MPITDQILPMQTPHDEAEELLPWYANGQLDEADRAKVDAHLSCCDQCRRQLALERQLIDEFQGMVQEVESGWVRLRNRIQAPANAHPLTPNKSSRPPEAWATIWPWRSRTIALVFDVP